MSDFRCLVLDGKHQLVVHLRCCLFSCMYICVSVCLYMFLPVTTAAFGDKLIVELEKTAEGMGFNIMGGKEQKCPIYISRIPRWLCRLKWWTAQRRSASISEWTGK